MKENSLPGVFDLLPRQEEEEWRQIHLWHYLEEVIRKHAHSYGYEEIRTPLFERTELFKRSVGTETDIVSKEMYTFEDKGGRSLTLRPEGTAPAIRAFIEHNLDQSAPYHKLFYIAPMFRYERAQAGRFRQHHQFGVETIGLEAPEQDAETIDLLYTLFLKLGLKEMSVHISSIGDSESRKKYVIALKSFLKDHLDHLSQESQLRFEKNPLRILDSKDPHDKHILKGAPSILDFLDSDCHDHFQSVLKWLSALHIPYVINHHIVRGLDYYNKTVFEFVSNELGAQNSLGGGGRYDGLLKELGGPDLPALGFGAGLERILQVLIKTHAPLPKPYRPHLYLIALGFEAKKKAFLLSRELRMEGIDILMEYRERKLKQHLHFADEIEAKYVAILGEEELKKEEIQLKNMASHETEFIPLSSLVRIMKLEAKADPLLKMMQEIEAPFQHKKEVEFFAKKLSLSISAAEKMADNLKKAVHQIETLM